MPALLSVLALAVAIPSLLLAEKFHFRAYESPRVPRLTLHHVPEQADGVGGVVMIEAPVAHTIAHRVEGEPAFEILRSRGRRWQHSRCRKLPLIKVEESQIEIQVGLGVLNIGRDSCQSSSRLCLFSRTAQGNI